MVLENEWVHVVVRIAHMHHEFNAYYIHVDTPAQNLVTIHKFTKPKTNCSIHKQIEWHAIAIICTHRRPDMPSIDIWNIYIYMHHLAGTRKPHTQRRSLRCVLSPNGTTGSEKSKFINLSTSSVFDVVVVVVVAVVDVAVIRHADNTRYPEVCILGCKRISDRDAHMHTHK